MTYQKSRDSPEVGVKDMAMIRSYIFLPLRVKGRSRESVGTVAKYADSRQKNARSIKGTCGNSGGNTNNGGSNKTCNFCGLKGHKDTGYFRKFPEKAPPWYKEKTVKTESASSNVEVSFTSLDPAKLGIDIALLQAKCDDTLAILCQENMWICDMGASKHMTWSNRGAKKCA